MITVCLRGGELLIVFYKWTWEKAACGGVDVSNRYVQISFFAEFFLIPPIQIMLLSSCMKYRAPCSHNVLVLCGEKGLVILTVGILGWNCETVSQLKVVTESKQFLEARHVKCTPIKEIILARLLTRQTYRDTNQDRKGYKSTYTNKTTYEWLQIINKYKGRSDVRTSDELVQYFCVALLSYRWQGWLWGEVLMYQTPRTPQWALPSLTGLSHFRWKIGWWEGDDHSVCRKGCDCRATLQIR